MSSGSPNSSSRAVLKRKKSSLSEARITVLGDRDVGKSGENVFACSFIK